MPDKPFTSNNRPKETDFSSIRNPSTQYDSFASSASSSTTATSVIENGGSESKGPLGLNLLYSPSEPLIDFIFVHGLNGGSRKTWSKGDSVKQYWPQEWLPKDPAFKSVRIHSFGYNSDWIKGNDSCLNIHHFGKSLLVGMSTSPYLGNTKTPMVLIGHSMGGLVIKKAYTLARQDATYEALAKRVHTIYFLATPHRGSASAKFLSNLLHAAYSSRAYVTDLKRGSGTIQVINDEFRNYSADISLWSFYETEKLKMGVFSALIVDPDSAILGYREETQVPMNADHRSICKFDTSTDPNYLTIRNSLASTVATISQSVKSEEKLWRSQIKDLEKYLGVFDNVEDDLAIAEDTRFPGTCEWLSKKGTFKKWKGFASDSPSVLWITGKPAAGKSVLAGYAIAHLRKEADCSYFFFKYGDKYKSRLGACLRSMAFQMACTNAQVRDSLLEMLKDDIKFDKDNESTIWRKLFLSGILQTKFPRHYWVIDALDECVNSSSFFGLMLAKLDGSTPLRILIMSRETAELERSFMTLGTHLFQSEKILTSDTRGDIELLVQAKAKSLVVNDEADRAVLVEKVLAKSKGSFLWTVLVLNELSNSYSEEEISQVLEDVPRGMEPLYRRTLELMSQATRGKKVSSAILTWVTCATRPLAIDELDGAMKLEVKGMVHKLGEAIMALCGQLVAIDRFGKVQMVHETAREFLLNEDLESEFAINRIDAHTRIARTCLTYLTEEEMRPLRSGRHVSANAGERKLAGFSQYACEAFSYHLSKADPLSNDVFALVNKFLESNVLSWIEIIARTQNLIPLIRAAKNIRTYLNARAAIRSPLGMEMQLIRGWMTDLFRIVAKFGDALILSPSAIYSLILPFCPTGSTVYNTAKAGRRLSVAGLSSTQWDDRLCCINFPRGQASAVCHGDEFLAVGLTTGTVMMYHITSFQEYKILNHGESVKFLDFKSKSDLIASCGIKAINIWDIRSGQIIHNFQAPQHAIFLAFDKNLLIAASQKNFLASWDLENDGARQRDRPWNDSEGDLDSPLRRPPRAISISVEHKMLAVGYSGQPITLWDLEADRYYGTCGKKLPNGETSTHVVSAIVFNPNINIGLLAVAYLDGELALIDPFADQEIESLRANCHTLAASPDGRLLAGGAGSGIVQIYEFDTLRLLYQVKASNLFIRQLAFSRDNLHFADIRGSQCNIWEPAALLRDMVRDDSSDGTSASVIEAVAQETKIKICTLIIDSKGEVVFCGKEDGSVSVYDAKTGAQLRTLYRHKSLVRTLTWGPQNNVIVSVDASNGIFSWKLNKTRPEGWVAEKMQFQSRLDCGRSIIQVLLSEAAGKFVLSTRESDHLWSIDGLQKDVRTYSKKPGIRRWIQHPQSQLHMICFDGAEARIYDWSDWSEIISMPLNIEVTGLQLKSITSYTSTHKQRILLELSELDGSANTRRLNPFDVASFSVALDSAKENIADPGDAKKNLNTVSNTKKFVDSIVLDSLLDPLTRCVAHVVGVNDTGKLIFLDTHSWVCSTDLEAINNRSISYTRHFFVPYDWFSGMRDIVCAVLRRNVLFARGGDVVIIKGGLEHVEMVERVQDKLGTVETQRNKELFK